MDTIDSSNATNLETKNKRSRKKFWNKLCCTRTRARARAIVLHKLTMRELYSVVLLLSSGNIPTSQKFYHKVFPNENFDWDNIYILPRVVNGAFNGIFNTKYFITYYI